MKPTSATGFAFLSLATVAFAQLDVPAVVAPDAETDAAKTQEAAETTDDAPEVELPEGAVPAPAVQEADPALEGLTQEERQELKKILDDASRFIGGIRLQEGLSKLIEAEQIAPGLFQIYNLRGAAYTKMKDFDTAREQFEKAIASRPGIFHPQFNLAEIEFVTDDYAGAEKSFKKLLAEFPDMDLGTKRLLEFKIIICRLKLGDPDGAMAQLETFNYLDDTPIYHLGHAAVAYSKEDTEDAEAWMASANKIYSAGQMEVFRDSLIEAGWIDTL